MAGRDPKGLVKINDEFADRLMRSGTLMVSHVPKGYTYELTEELCRAIGARFDELGRALTDEEFVAVAERFRG